jgi:hypothetical protein
VVPQVSIMLTQSILPTATALWAGKGYRQWMTGDRPTPLSALSAGQSLLALPFDALRAQYAGVVRAGLAPRSIVDSGQWERRLDALEKLTLGPLARQR